MSADVDMMSESSKWYGENVRRYHAYIPLESSLIDFPQSHH